MPIGTLGDSYGVRDTHLVEPWVRVPEREDVPDPIAAWLLNEGGDAPVEYFSGQPTVLFADGFGNDMTWQDTPLGPGLGNLDNAGTGGVVIIHDDSDPDIRFDLLAETFTPGRLSLEFWGQAINDNFNGGQPRFIQKGIGAAASQHDWMIGLSSSQFRARLNTGGSTTTILGSGALTNQQVYHFVMTYDGADIRMYEDGVEVNSAAHTGIVRAQATSDVVMFNTAASGTNTNHYDGVGLKVAVYDYCLTPGQIGRLFSDPAGRYNAGPNTFMFRAAVAATGVQGPPFSHRRVRGHPSLRM